MAIFEFERKTKDVQNDFTIDVCPVVSAVVFRGSASAEDKYTLNSFKSALNVNTAGGTTIREHCRRAIVQFSRAMRCNPACSRHGPRP